MKVVHLSSTDFWDQGILAHRIFKSTLNFGVDGVFITLMKNSGDPKVKSIIQDPIFKDKTKLVMNVSFNMPTPFFSILDMWRNKFGFKIMEREGSIIASLPYTTINVLEIKEIQEADIIHIHWAPGMIDYELAPIYLLDKPVIITQYDESCFTGICHSTGDCTNYLDGCRDCPLLSEDSKKLASEAFNVKKQAYELMDITLVAQNSYFETMAQKSGIFKEIHKINPIASPYIFKNRISRKTAREILGLDQHSKIFLCVATSFSREMIDNIHKFLAAISSIKKEIRRPYVIIIGDGAYEIERIPGIPLHPLPEIPHEEALNWYFSAADIFLSPFKDNEMSIYPLDALSAGLPILGFDCEFLRDLVDHTKNGYLARWNQNNDIINGIRWILSCDQRKFVNISRAKVKKLFSFEAQGEKYRSLYEMALKKRKKIDFKEVISVGEKYYRDARKDLALMLFEKLHSMYPDNADVINNLGVIYWEAKEYKKAYNLFKRAYEIAPENTSIRENYENAKIALDL